MNKINIKVLTDKIQNLENQNEKLRDDLARERTLSFASMVGVLRLYQVALIYCGAEPISQLRETLAARFDSDIENQISNNLFNLNNASPDNTLIETFRKLFNNGLCRW